MAAIYTTIHYRKAVRDVWRKRFCIFSSVGVYIGRKVILTCIIELNGEIWHAPLIPALDISVLNQALALDVDLQGVVLVNVDITNIRERQTLATKLYFTNTVTQQDLINIKAALHLSYNTMGIGTYLI